MSNIGTISLINKTDNFERTYFLNNPDITFFKSVYRKHTNFCKYLRTDILIHADISTDDDSTDKGSKVISPGTDDLLSKLYLENKIYIIRTLPVDEVDTPTKNITIFPNLGSNFIKDDDPESLSITIDNNRSIFKSGGLFQEVKGELLNQMSLTSNSTCTQAPCLNIDTDGIISCKNGSHYNYTTLSGGVIGVKTKETDWKQIHANDPSKQKIETEYFYTIPEFSFMKDYGLALPLLSMKNTGGIQFNVKFKTKDQIFKCNSLPTAVTFKYKYECNLIQELIHLDTDEKSRFLTSQLTYLTESVDRVDISNNNQDIKSNFKLCKYLLLVGKPSNTIPEYKISVSPNTPTSLLFSELNITIGGNNLYPSVNRLKKEIFTKININKYFPGCGRDLKGAPFSASVTFNDTSTFTVSDSTLAAFGNIKTGMSVTGFQDDGTNKRIVSTKTDVLITVTPAIVGGYSEISTLTFSSDAGQLDSIAMIPFSIEPLNYTQPSGCISNKGQIGSIKLNFEEGLVGPNIVLYAINYNILQISDGKAQVMNH